VEEGRKEMLFEPLSSAYTKNYVVEVKKRGRQVVVQNEVLTKISSKFLRKKYKFVVFHLV